MRNNNSNNSKETPDNLNLKLDQKIQAIQCELETLRRHRTAKQRQHEEARHELQEQLTHAQRQLNRLQQQRSLCLRVYKDAVQLSSPDEGNNAFVTALQAKCCRAMHQAWIQRTQQQLLAEALEQTSRYRSQLVHEISEEASLEQVTLLSSLCQVQDSIQSVQSKVLVSERDLLVARQQYIQQRLLATDREQIQRQLRVRKWLYSGLPARTLSRANSSKSGISSRIPVPLARQRSQRAERA